MPGQRAIASACLGKAFLNVDDAAFDDNLRRFLHEGLPDACKFEAEKAVAKKSATYSPVEICNW